MKILAITIFYFLLTLTVFAQNDSSAYVTQRNKINQLLDDRSMKFAQYDNSLNKRSGIFGLKTKRDMQFSNDILRDIVLTDNNIFSELKILLDYKDFEKKEVKSKAELVESYVKNYQSTITRLQNENERLKIELERQDKQKDRLFLFLFLLLTALVLSVFYLFKTKRLRNADKGNTGNA